MRKMVLLTVGAFMLLLAPLLAWNSQAVAYSGIIAIEPSHSPLQKVECKLDDKTFPDDLCGDGKHLVCQPVDNGPPKCQCVDCGGHGACPKSATICCAPGTCCSCGIGGIKCCPR